MPKIDDLTGMPRKQLHVFYVLDTSGSMEGAKISTLNHAMDECTQALKTIADTNADAELKIAILEFNSGCNWMTVNGPESLEDFEYDYCKAGGLTDIGSALAELDTKLSRKTWLKSMVGAFYPIIIFMTDGYATDDYEKKLEEIRKNKWFHNAIKIGFAIGDDADTKMISSIVGNCEAVVKTSDLELFKRLIKFVTVRSTTLASTSRTSNDEVTGEKIIEDVTSEMLDTTDNDISVHLTENEYNKESSSEDEEYDFDDEEW